MTSQSPIILFDGVCNFCNFWVKFILKRDKKKKLLFSPIQSESARMLIKKYRLSIKDLSTVIFIENDKVYSQSSATLRIARHLGSAWPIFYGLMIIPKFIRDAIYNIIARNRYRWFGRKDACMVPTPELRERFLD